MVVGLESAFITLAITSSVELYTMWVEGSGAPVFKIESNDKFSI